MTTKEFVEKYSGVPLDLFEVAEIAEDIVDGYFAKRAEALLDAKCSFEEALYEIGLYLDKK